jgi:hypothetical protein
MHQINKKVKRILFWDGESINYKKNAAGMIFGNIHLKLLDNEQTMSVEHD